MSVLTILANYYPILLGGLGVTLELFLMTSVIGIVLGILFGSLGARYGNTIGVAVRITSFLIAGIPLLVLLYWFYYPFQSILNISIDPFFTAVIVLAVVDVAAVAELVRGVLADFPKQYNIVGQMSGLSDKQIFQKIQFPMIFRQIIPSFLTMHVYILQATLFASLISVEEIFRVAQNLNSVIYQPIAIYSSLAVFFILILAPLNYLAYTLKQRFTRDLSE